MAHDAVDAAVAAAGLGATAPAGPGPEVAGGDGFGPLWEDRERLASSAGLALEQVERLLYRYGSLAPDVLGSTAVAEPLAPLQGGSGYLRAEVAYAVSDEGARHVEDVLRRRTRLAVETPDGALAAAQEVAGVMAPVLGGGATSGRAAPGSWSPVAPGAWWQPRKRGIRSSSHILSGWSTPPPRSGRT